MAAAWYKEIPDDQKICYAVTPLPGAMLRARLVAAQIAALSEAMIEIGDEKSYDCEVFLGDVHMDSDGTLRFSLAVMPRMDSDLENRT